MRTLQEDELQPRHALAVAVQRLDELEIRVQATAKLHDEGPAAIPAVQSEANRLMRETLGLSASVVVVPPGALPRSEGKAKRIIDRRAL